MARGRDLVHGTRGAVFSGSAGAVLLYRSPDLVSWEYMHPLCVGAEPGYNRWLVPDFFPLGDRHVLLATATSRGRSGKAIYMVGEYRDHRFTPEVEGYLDTHPMGLRPHPAPAPPQGVAQEGRRLLSPVLGMRAWQPAGPDPRAARRHGPGESPPSRKEHVRPTAAPVNASAMVRGD